MQRLSPMLLLMLALVCGGLAAYLAVGWLKTTSNRARRTAQQAVQLVPVVVAAKEIPPGTMLGGEHLKVMNWPREAMVTGMATEPAKVQGRVVRHPLVTGEPILENKLAPQGTPAGLAGIIQNERRALTVKVDEATGVAGFILPGNRVDVLVTLDKREFKDDPVTQVILQNLLVLGRGQDLEQAKAGDKPKIVPTITLEVTPEEAEKLALAAKEGNITLALRGWSEGPTVATAGVKASSLLPSGQKAAASFEAAIVPPTAPKRAGVEILRGTARETVTF